MKFRTDTYTAITLFGIVEVDFPEDGGVVFDGPASAVEHLKSVIDGRTGTNGISLTPQNLEPYDFYHFCQPKGSMVTILEPWDDLLSGRSPYRNNDDDEGDGYAVMDDASGMGMNLASAGNMSLLDMRRDLKMAPTVQEKLTIMRAMLSHLNATGALATQEAQARAQANRERQMMNLDTINKQKAFLEANKDPKRMVASKVAAYRNLRAKANQLRDRINNPKATESAVIKNRATLYDVEARMSGLARDIEASASLVKKSTTYQYGEVKEKSEPTTLVSIITQFETNAKRGDSGDDALIDELTGARWSRSGNSLELKETGPIQEEWQAEMDMANAMIEGAIEAYEAQAQEAGGMPEKFARMLVAGTAIMVDGAPVMNGAMSRYNDSVALAVIDLPNGVKKVVSMQVDGRNAYMGFDNMVNPGTAEHLAMMQYAAKLEDDLAAAGQSVKTFSELVPEIAAMRVTRTPAQYRTDKYTLPHPYFPFVATEYQARSSLVWGRIAEQQAAIVKSRDHSTFTVDPDVAVVEHKGDYAADRDKAIVAYALANGIKMEAGFDIKANEIKEMVARIDIGEFKAALPGSSKAEVERNAAKFIESKLTQIIEFTNLSASSPDIMPVEFLDAIIEARRAATGSSGDNPKEIVGITGNTKKWMGEIKYAANTHGDGKYRWHKGTLTWNVYRSAWDALTNNNPAAEKELRLVRSKFYTL